MKPSKDVIPSKKLRIVLINAENLFIFLNRKIEKPLKDLSEGEWQSLSSSTLPQKELLKTKWLAETIQSYSPDLILLCEVGGLESLQNWNEYFLDSQFEPKIIEGNSERGIDIGYLVKKGLPYEYELSSYKDMQLPPMEHLPDETHYFSRDLLQLNLTHPNTETPALILLLTHLKSKWDRTKIDPEGRIKRSTEVLKITEIIKELTKKWGASVPLALAGDLNAQAREAQREPEFAPLFEKTDLEELFDVLKRPEEETATQVVFKQGYKRHLVQIDHFLVNSALQKLILPEECSVGRYPSEQGIIMPYPETISQRTQLPSDHFPVILTIELP